MTLRRLPWVLVVVAAAILPHLGSLRGHFHYDDDHVILLNRQNLQDPGSILKMFDDASVFSGISGNRLFRPVTHATQVLDAHLWPWTSDGPEPLGWHITNLLIHAAAAVALFFLLRRILGHWLTREGAGEVTLAAALGAVWFAMHPVNSEVVNYITSRSESLAALFFVLSLLAHHRAWDDDVRGDARWLLILLSIVLAFLSFGSKETGVLLPAVAGALELWARRDAPSGVEGWKRAVIRALPLLAVMVGYLILRRAVLDVATVDLSTRNLAGDGVDPLTGGGRSLAGQALTQSRVLVNYGLLLLFPVDLSPDHGVRVSGSLDGPTILAVLLVLGVLAGVVFATVRGNRTVPLVASWAALTIAPSVLVPLNVVMNEHRLYLPSTGLALGAGLIMLRLLQAGRKSGRSVFAVGLLGAMLFGFAAVDVDRSRDWSDPFRLWSKAVETSPRSWRNHLHLAVERFRLGERTIRAGEVADGGPDADAIARGVAEVDRALLGFQDAHALYPGAFEARLNLGFAHMLRGRVRNRGGHPDEPPAEPEHYIEAVKWFRLAEESSPGSFRALYNEATCLALAGRNDEAIERFETLAQDKSRTTLYAYPLADLYRRKGEWDAAMLWLDIVLEVEPRDQGIVALKKGEVLTHAGRFKEADEALREAFRVFGKEDPLPGVYKARLLSEELKVNDDPAKRQLLKVIWNGVTRGLGYRPGPKDRGVLEALGN